MISGHDTNITRDDPGKPSTEESKTQWGIEAKSYAEKDIPIKDLEFKQMIREAKQLVDVPMNYWGITSQPSSMIFTSSVFNCLTILVYNKDAKIASLAHLNGSYQVQLAGDAKENTKIVFNNILSFTRALIEKTKTKESISQITLVFFKGSSFTKGKNSEGYIIENLIDYVTSEFENEHVNIIDLTDKDSIIGNIYSAVLFNPHKNHLHLINIENDSCDFMTQLKSECSELMIETSDAEIIDLLPKNLEETSSPDTPLEKHSTDQDTSDSELDLFSGMEMYSSASSQTVTLFDSSNENTKEETSPKIDSEKIKYGY